MDVFFLVQLLSREEPLGLDRFFSQAHLKPKDSPNPLETLQTLTESLQDHFSVPGG